MDGQNASPPSGNGLFCILAVGPVEADIAGLYRTNPPAYAGDHGGLSSQLKEVQHAHGRPLKLPVPST
ncbi:MAG: hypothetical protein Kow0047_17950 [Anaerolineae bacterium]